MSLFRVLSTVGDQAGQSPLHFLPPPPTLANVHHPSAFNQEGEGLLGEELAWSLLAGLFVHRSGEESF